MNQTELKEYYQLCNVGWEMQKTNQIRFNGGSESVDHMTAKALAAHAGKDEGYRVNSEISHPTAGEIDILLWGNEGRLTLAVECETNPDDETIEDKVDRYVRDMPIDDIVFINVSTLPRDRLDAYQEVKEAINLER